MNKIKRKNKQDKGIEDKTRAISTVLGDVHMLKKIARKKVSNHNQKSDRRVKGNIPSWIIGIDEVGRGPLAGPVAVTAYAMPFLKSKSKTYAMHRNFFFSFVKKKYPVRMDSKAMSEREREEWFSVLKHIKNISTGDKNLSSSHHMFVVYKTAPASMIDTKGIAVCIQNLVDTCLKECLKKISRIRSTAKPHALVLLDGGLSARVKMDEITYTQKTIVKGDVREMVISLASVYAKCTRDRYMRSLHKNPTYNLYRFDVHKGYGTLLHRKVIRQNGLSDQHRRSFCKRLT